jgi:hypothetical protein
MAALALAAGLCQIPTRTLAGDPPAANPGVEAKTQTVTLVLRIAGLGTKGCDVEIKPGHPGCEFQPVTRHVASSGELSVEVKDVVIKNADRDCTFAITIREPGESVRTMRRGLRVGAARESQKTPTLVCYLSSPSRIAKTEGASTSKR